VTKETFIDVSGADSIRDAYRRGRSGRRFLNLFHYDPAVCWVCLLTVSILCHLVRSCNPSHSRILDHPCRLSTPDFTEGKISGRKSADFPSVLSTPL
jgi:hypothetical protein